MRSILLNTARFTFALVSFASLVYILGCETVPTSKPIPVEKQTYYQSITFQQREIELFLMHGTLNTGTKEIMVQIDSGAYIKVMVEDAHSYDRSKPLPENGATVWFFPVPRGYVDPDFDEYDPSTASFPSFVAVNITTTPKKLDRQKGENIRRTPCGTKTTIQNKVQGSRTLHHVINDYGQLVLLEAPTGTDINPWDKVVGDTSGFSRVEPPLGIANRIETTLLQTSYVGDDWWKWVDR